MILEKLQEHHDFPAMSNTVEIINKFEISEDVSVSEFANIVLKDYALTSKVLKLVNSVSYSQFGEVTTISRAIVLLGFENIKNLALTLMLFDHFQKNSSNAEHMDTMVKSFYSGILAQRFRRICLLPIRKKRLSVLFSTPSARCWCPLLCLIK